MATKTHNQQLHDTVLDLTKSAQNPSTWAMQLSSHLRASNVPMPSIEVSKALVSYICWSNNVPMTWKLLDTALNTRIVPPALVLALLSVRVIPCRKSYPGAYRLYLELVKKYVFPLSSLVTFPNYHKILESISEVLLFDRIFGGAQLLEPGCRVVGFVLAIISGLLDASLDDEGLLEFTQEKKFTWFVKSEDMEVDFTESVDGSRMDSQAALSKGNSVMAIELIGEFFRNNVTSQILNLVRRNMPMHWEYFEQHLRVLIAKSSYLRNSENISPEVLMQLTLSHERKVNSDQQFHSVMARSPILSAGQYHGTIRSAPWLPIDLYLEDVMDGSQVKAISASETLTGLLKALKALNQATWQDAFLGLWIAALRLVQREKNSSEGPVPRLDTCLCLLLSIATLSVANIVAEDEEETVLTNEAERSSINQRKTIGNCRQDLVSSLQLLGDFEGLLSPPPPVSALADQAASKAMMFLSDLTTGLDGMVLNDMPLNCSGNLRHLIIEACIARNVLDTSAYTWPGYVKGRFNQIPRNVSGKVPGWSSILKGSSLALPVVNVLVSTPASSLAEIEKMYDIAVSGTEEEKISAATIFCGASLSRGWNIQEYTGLSIIRLLSPAAPKDFSESESHLISHAPFLNTILVGISSIDSIQIFSLHGLVPQLAAALMPICEVFGSCPPNMSWTLNTGEEISSHAVFSNAFTLLLKLWRFDRPPLEHVKGDVPPVGSPLTPEYLLLERNSQLASSEGSPNTKSKRNRLSRLSYPSSSEPILLDSFPKLKRWHRQHQECIASILSDLVPGNPTHQIVETLLNMMFKKINKGTPTSSENSSSPASGTADSCKSPAWDILEAVPFVLDAALTACAHGRLSPRELTTGLKDLADFLPASLATIVSYLSAEVTRGLWKPASMNGTDWPSPAANLSMVEQHINKILAATGVIIPCLSVEISSQVTLPLPLAALLSLTITYKLDRDTSRFLNLIGPAVSNLGIGCPWPCMPIIAALWAQKAKRWSDFLVFSASQTVFHHNNDAIVQLLRVCFSAALGLKSSLEASNGGVGAFLGHGFGSHFTGGISAVAPGILYLRVHRAVTNIMFMTEEIVSILMQTVKDVASSGLLKDQTEKLKKAKYSMNYGQVSLACTMSQVKQAASLAASLVWITGEENLVQSLIKETLPSWFISGHGFNSGESRGMVATLDGYALAYFILICGLFAWGVDSTSPASIRRPKVLAKHLEFLASVLDGKISLGCNKATWRAYVTGFTSLLVTCTPNWMREIDLEVLKRVSKGLKKWKEEELALALLGISGYTGVGAAAEMILETGF